MKTIYKKLLFLFLLLPFNLLAQNSLSGVIVDKKSNQPLPGVNVTVQGANKGTTSDFDGKFQLAGLKNGDVLVFSFIGYANETFKFTGQKIVTISLDESANQLQEVVVQVGYGSVKKKDVTGSVSVISVKDFNKGAILSADQLLVGKSPGVRITSNGGEPDSAPNIRIRGGSSLSVTNDPLIIIDGVPIDNQNAAGNSNAFSLINPNDIESFTILKDASATAIYGARASNGVIIITTKKGVSSGKPQFNYSTTFSFGEVGKQIKLKDSKSFVSFIQQYHSNLTNLLGVADPNAPIGTLDDLTTPVIEGRIIYNTNWQDAIFRKTISQDHNFSARANIFGGVPFRASVGYNRTEGVVKTNDYQRISASIKLTPTFFDKHLKVDVNAKGLTSKKNAIDAGGVIGNALSLDPTKPIYGDSPNNRFDGYYQQTTFDATTGRYSTFGQPSNPVSLLDKRTRPELINKFIGNLELDYKMHFLPDLHAVVNLGMEASETSIRENYSNNAIQTYQFNQGTDPATNYVFNPGLNYHERQTIVNKTFDAYLIYTKKLTGIISRFETQAGHTYQSFLNDGIKDNFQYNLITGIREPNINPQNPNNRYYNKLVLESYFERTSVDFLNKYLFTFTIRADASSLFAKDKRWGYFPAVGFAWKIKEENFLKNSSTFSDLKLRLGYGVTGNNDIRGIAGYYPNSPLFGVGNPNGQYLPGVNTYTALPFNSNLQWERTTTTNVGFDFELFKSKFISGSIDGYYKKTTDLLAKVPVAPGQYLTNLITTNVGSLSNKGVELNLNVKAFTTDDFSLSFNGNIAYNIGKVEDLNGNSRIIDDASGLPVQTGVKIGYNAVGEQPYSFSVFEQVYDTAGKPIANAYVDKNGDGQINDDDRYYVPVRPNWTFGFGTTFNYKKFDLTASFRGQLGGKVYNSRNLVGGWSDRTVPTLGTALSNVLDTEFYFVNINGNIPFSDYFIEDATFLRCENVTLGYKFDKLGKSASVRLFVAVNNLFIVTKYTGQDPENFNAIDNNFYPRPRVVSAGLNFDF